MAGGSLPPPTTAASLTSACGRAQGPGTPTLPRGKSTEFELENVSNTSSLFTTSRFAAKVYNNHVIANPFSSPKAKETNSQFPITVRDSREMTFQQQQTPLLSDLRREHTEVQPLDVLPRDVRLFHLWGPEPPLSWEASCESSAFGQWAVSARKQSASRGEHSCSRCAYPHSSSNLRARWGPRSPTVTTQGTSRGTSRPAATLTQWASAPVGEHPATCPLCPSARARTCTAHTGHTRGQTRPHSHTHTRTHTLVSPS